MTTNVRYFDFVLAVTDYSGVDSEMSFSLPLDSNYTSHFDEFLSSLVRLKIKSSDRVLSDLASEYCLAVIDNVFPGEDAE